MKDIQTESGDKMSPDKDAAFQSFVDELKPLALRGEEAIRAAVVVINRFQEKFGKAKKELIRLAGAVGVDVRTLYRWRRQVAGKKPKTKESKQIVRVLKVGQQVMFNGRLYEIGENAEGAPTFSLASILKPQIVPTQLSLLPSQDFDWGFYRENFLSHEEADTLFALASSWPRERQDSIYRGKVNGKKRIIGLRSYAVSPRERGHKDGVVNPMSSSIDGAPPEVNLLAEKLATLNDGKEVNYLSFIAYENERDHIAWHQHNEDRCRDATVYIVSMGERRTFGVRPVCEAHRFCAECCDRCHVSSRSLCRDCKTKNAARKSCKVCGDKTKWITFQPGHGSVIKLTDEANRTHEHAILGKQDRGGDKSPKTLRISVNTKHIRPEDIAEVRSKGQASMAGQPITLTAETIHAGIAPGKYDKCWRLTPDGPGVYCCRAGCRYPADAVYVGRASGKWPSTPFGNYTYAKTADAWQAEVDRLMQSQDFRQQVEALRGKDLLCWCRPNEEFCHARLWIELANSRVGSPE